MKTRLGKTTALLSTGVLALSLAACGADDDTSPTSEEPTQEQLDAFEDEDTQPDPADPDMQQHDDGDDAAAGDETQVEIGETLEDSTTDDSIEIVSAVRDFESTEETEVTEDGGEIVLVEVSVTPGADSNESISNDNFRISWDDGSEFHDDDTDEIDDELTESDREPLEEVSSADGEQTGWLAFFVEEEADSYLLEYSRPAADDDDDDTEAELVTEVEIPAP